MENVIISHKFHVKSFETASHAKKNKVSTQMAARQLRYNWFNSLLINRNANYIATAHHKDDSIETFFINLIRKIYPVLTTVNKILYLKLIVI